MSDISKMTDRELQVEIAKALGYRVEFALPKPKLRYPKWILIQPDGTRAPYQPLAKSEDPNDLYVRITWRMLEDVNVALELIADYDATIDLSVEGAAVRLYALATAFEATAPELARAICEAWLSKKRAEEAKK